MQNFNELTMKLKKLKIKLDQTSSDHSSLEMIHNDYIQTKKEIEKINANKTADAVINITFCSV